MTTEQEAGIPALPKKKSKFLKRFVLFLLFIVFYLITSIPVGLFLYTIKSNRGIDVFSHTGFHGYLSCLHQEAVKALQDDE